MVILCCQPELTNVFIFIKTCSLVLTLLENLDCQNRQWLTLK